MDKGKYRSQQRKLNCNMLLKCISTSFTKWQDGDLTFSLSNLSSTSCNQDMNCRALNLSLTDVLPSSVCETNTQQLQMHGTSPHFNIEWILIRNKTQGWHRNFNVNNDHLPARLEACYRLQHPVKLYRHWKEESDWPVFSQLGNGLVRLPVH